MMAPALQQHEPRNAAGVLPDVVHDDVLELARQSIERLVGALVWGPPATPVEELDQRAAKLFILERRAIDVGVEPEQKPLETGSG